MTTRSVKMFKVFALMTMCVVCGVASSPTVLFSKPLVVQGAAKNTESVHLSSSANLEEKPRASIESQKPISSSSDSHVQSFSPLPGTRNLAERIQIKPAHLRGTENLAEKAIPEAVIARITQDYQKKSSS